VPAISLSTRIEGLAPAGEMKSAVQLADSVSMPARLPSGGALVPAASFSSLRVVDSVPVRLEERQRLLELRRRKDDALLRCPVWNSTRERGDVGGVVHTDDLGFPSSDREEAAPVAPSPR
jgi:hypothetical protein